MILGRMSLLRTALAMQLVQSNPLEHVIQTTGRKMTSVNSHSHVRFSWCLFWCRTALSLYAPRKSTCVDDFSGLHSLNCGYTYVDIRKILVKCIGTLKMKKNGLWQLLCTKNVYAVSDSYLWIMGHGSNSKGTQILSKFTKVSVRRFLGYNCRAQKRKKKTRSAWPWLIQVLLCGFLAVFQRCRCSFLSSVYYNVYSIFLF